jgi:hypothetical protein
MSSISIAVQLVVGFGSVLAGATGLTRLRSAD